MICAAGAVAKSSRIGQPRGRGRTATSRVVFRRSGGRLRRTPGLIAQFGSPEQAEFPHGHRRTADSLVATLATKAGLLVMPDQERAATLGRIRAYLAARPETARGEFTLPMLTGVLRVRRLRTFDNTG